MKFSDFVFNRKLETELNWLLDNPKKIPPVLCFYGYPGNGKTSFSEYIANEVGGNTTYIDMNDYMANGNSIGNILEQIKGVIATRSLFDCGTKIWRQVIILDEFHNATNRQQDTLKTILEKYSKNNQCLFILCLNIQGEQTIDKVITPAIRSRVHPILFNTKIYDLPELTQSIKDKFPMLSIEDIKKNIPDMRRIQRCVSMS